MEVLLLSPMKTLSTFLESKEEAHEAYNQAAEHYFGKFRRKLI